MKNMTKANPGQAVPFTLQVLDDLKKRGFLYVQVNAFTSDNRHDYMEPHYFVLVPILQLPDDINQKGIYEPINSQVLTLWADSPNEGIKVFVAAS